MASSLPADLQLQSGSRALAGQKGVSPEPAKLPQVSTQGLERLGFPAVCTA